MGPRRGFEAAILGAIESARLITLDWVAPDLPPHFDAAAYVRQLFRTSFRFEVRPESGGRADALYDAQADQLIPIFERVLENLGLQGRVSRRADGSFCCPDPSRAPRRSDAARFSEWSRVRATARWPKHAITFDGWLDYIIRKAERHSGETIVLTPLERRFPLILLWPRVFQFLARQRRRGRSV